MPNNTDAIARLKTVRGKIEQLQSKRKVIAAEPCTHAEAHERIDVHVEAIARGASPGDARISNPPKVQVERLKPPAFVPGVYPLLECDSLEQGLALIVPDALREFLHARLEEHLAGRAQGISHDKRAKGLARIDQEVRKLEVEEEVSICEFEASGLSLHRRANASPKIVLEVTEDEPDQAA